MLLRLAALGVDAARAYRSLTCGRSPAQTTPERILARAPVVDLGNAAVNLNVACSLHSTDDAGCVCLVRMPRLTPGSAPDIL